jgi:poly-gamma-glutamate capsule biosynthesis protein CapA/YwtB (metallophosphatase superfamily)
MHHLDQAGIAYFGGGRNLAEAHKAAVDREKGPEDRRPRLQRIQAARLRSRRRPWPGVAWSEDDQVIADIRAAKAAGADLVIPFMHWGWEKETKPSERQKSFARKMIDEGAALVVGSHPHVTQGAEIYKGKPIIYSLGNFVFDGFDYPEPANAAGCCASNSTNPA